LSEFETQSDQAPGGRPTVDQAVARRVGIAAVLLVVIAAGVFMLLQKPPAPAPAEIASDPLLVEGRAVYLSRCVSCHGESGRGDGPIAKGLAGPPVRDLTGRKWKHGDAPGQALAVVREGVKDSAMPGWGKVLNGQDVKAVTAYVYYLAKRDVPAALREP
jgi:cytochrome c oxidase cbb3-type subunit 3